MKPAYIPAHSRGFTLIEITIVLVLFSIILLLLVNSLYTATQYWDFADRQLEEQEEFRLTHVFLRKTISQLIPLLWVDQKRNQEKILFTGEREYLRFVAVLPVHYGGDALQILTLKKLEQVDQGTSIQLSWEPLHADQRLLDTDHSQIPKDSQSIILASDIKTFQLEYYGREYQQEATLGKKSWQEEWQDPLFTPELIRITIQTAQIDTLHPLVIPIHTTGTDSRSLLYSGI